MGKAKKTNKRSGLGNVAGVALPDHRSLGLRATDSHGKDRFALSELEGNLGSLEENQRSNACALLSDLYQFNSHNATSMESLASKKLLSKLAMRLIDHSSLVRVAATRALKVLTEGKDVPSIQRVVSVGIFRTALSLTIEHQSTVLQDVTVHGQAGMHSIEIQQNLLYAVANVVSSHQDCIDEIVEHHKDYVPFLLTAFSQLLTLPKDINGVLNQNRMALLNTIANVMIIFTKCKESAAMMNDLIGVQGVSIIQQVAAHFLSILGPLESILVDDSNMDNIILLLQSVEMLINVSLHPSTHSSIVQSIDMQRLLDTMVHCIPLCHRSIEQQNTVDVPVPVTKKATEGEEGEQEMEVDGVTTITSNIQVGNGDNSSPMYDIDFVEMLSDLFLILSERILVATSDESILVASGFKKKASIQNDLEKRSQMIVTYLDGLKCAPKLFAILPSLRTRIAKHLHVSEEHGDLQLLTRAGVRCFMVMEKLLSAVNDMYTIKTIVSATSVDWSLPNVGLLEHLQFLQDSVTNTTASLDTNTNFASERWRAREEDDLLPLKSTIVTQACSMLDLIAQVSGHSVLGTQYQGYHVLGEEDLKNFAVALLRWMNFPQLEIVFSAVNIIAHLVNEEKSQISPSAASIPITIIMLITNGLFNRMSNSSAYTFGLDKEKVAHQITKSINVKKSTTMLLDCCVNAIIDLHSSDDLQYHGLFVKLQGINKLKSILQDLHNKYEESSRFLDDDDRDKVEETIMNLSNFIEYKEQGFK